MGSLHFNEYSYSQTVLDSRKSGLAAFEIFKQTLNPILLFQTIELVFKRPGFEDHVAGRIRCLVALDGSAKSVQDIRCLVRVGKRAGGIGFACSSGAAVLRYQYLASGSRLRQFLLKAPEGVAKSICLSILIFQLLREACRELLAAQTTLERSAGQIILLLLNSEFGLSIPLVHGILMLLQFFLEKVLVSNRDGNLRLDLEKLIFHVQDELLCEFLGIFSLLDEIVNVRS
jgi:hypothetical protein